MARERGNEARYANPRDAGDAVRKTLERAVAAVCPRWLSEQREDIVQSAMRKVLFATQDEQNRLLASSYLWKVAYSATADEIRQRRRMAIPMEMSALEQKSPAAAVNPLEDREAGETGRAIRSCLRQIAEARRVVVQFHLLGHSLPEIEVLTAWNGKRVRNLLYRGMSDLRGCLVMKGYTP